MKVLGPFAYTIFPLLSNELLRVASAGLINYYDLISSFSAFREGLIFFNSMSLTTGRLAGLTFTIGIALTVVGVIVALLAVVLSLTLSNRKDAGQTKGGGILLIGPIPIIFGTDRESAKILIMLATALLVVVTALMVFPYLLRK